MDLLNCAAMPAEGLLSATALVGLELPKVTLPSTSGGAVDFTRLPSRCLLILHPLALARRQVPPPAWSRIPGAAGCTDQLLGFKARYQEFQARRVALFGISTQSSPVQQAVAEDLALPFPLLSDASRVFASALNLPMLHAGRVPRMMRIVLAIRHCVIEQVFYPVETPSQSAAEVLSWLSLQPL